MDVIVMANMNPAVSIVMPLFNKANQVLKTITSAQSQTISNWELVIIDDGSTDGGERLVAELGDERIHVFSQLNRGVSDARNRGIEKSKSNLIAFLDADDLWHPGFLATILKLQTDFPEAKWYATAYEIHLENGKTLIPHLFGKNDFRRGILKNYFSVATKSDPPVWSSAVAVQKDAIKMIGGFPVGIESGEDLLTWSRLAARFSLAYDTKPQAVWVKSGINRMPDKYELVGKALDQLAHENPSIVGIADYVGLWYRMQAVTALKFKQLSLARKFAFRSNKYTFFNVRNIYILILTFIPLGIGLMIDQTLRKIIRQ